MSECPRHIHPVYRPSGAGPIIVYAGDLLLSEDGVERVTTGDLELRLSPKPEFFAHVAGSEPWLIMSGLNPEKFTVALPPGASIEPPTDSALAAEPEEASSWADFTIPITRLAAGDVKLAERLILHVSGPLTKLPLPVCHTDGGQQRQLSLVLPGWDLRLAAAGDPEAVEEFSFVVDAVPQRRPLDEDSARRLCRRVFVLLSLTAGQEIGVGPVVGLNAAGRVVWAEWFAPRFQPGRSPWRWCPKDLVNTALPVLAAGFSSLADNLGLEAVVDRAVNHLLAANGPGALDVRIPVACSGLELLGWAVLQRHQWLTQEVLGKPHFPASACACLLLQWAGIPVDLPAHLSALAARRGGVGQPEWAGPEVVFNVRNNLVHPPKKLDDPEWPSNDELFEAWQLATWCLELAIVRLLGYENQYASRLRRSIEPVPWRTKDTHTSGG